jgi:para-aminobenzoate synthetase / 4-amino-4-deoxychorismate lyase
MYPAKALVAGDGAFLLFSFGSRLTSMIEAVFGSGDPADSRSFHFTCPTRSYSAFRLDEVAPLLKEAELAAKSGRWVAVMLTYEAASAFDSALKTHQPDSNALACAAEFTAPIAVTSPPNSANCELTRWEPQITRSTFSGAVGRIQDLIASGDTYQVNYTFPLVSQFNGDPYCWYRRLFEVQKSDFCVYLNLGRSKILCLSPELFFQRRADKIETKPMKGTIQRGRWIAEDLAMAAALVELEKERAENVMIVDLLRNDLGKVCLPGSIHVSKLFQAERYPTLWQMTSTVEGNLRPDADLAGIMSALFPCGSITGAPKIRTMEIIRELENVPRGVYTGTIGLLRPGGDCTFNVAIRTVVIDSQSGVSTFGVGGGITIDSTSEREYAECLLKASFLEASTESFQLLETLLLEEGEFYLLHRHLERLRSSADYFDFHLSQTKVREELNRTAAHHAEGKWKVRLLLANDGEVKIDVSQVESPNPALRVGLAREPVDSANRFLFHKTTNRAMYDQALKQRPDCDDVVLWNERDEITESSVANIVVPIDGRLYTPPQCSGLLAGTFRAQLLQERKIEERVIQTEELRKIKRCFLINSVRKWQEAILV